MSRTIRVQSASLTLITAKYRRRALIAAVIGVLGMLALAPAAAPAAGSDPDYIVLYKSGTNVTAKVQSEEARGNDVQDVFRSAVKGFVAPLDAADVARLRASSDVLLVEKDKPVEALSAGPRSGPAASWGLDRIDQRTLPLDNQISTSQNGFGVTVYIIDTGIRADHSEFGGRVTVGFDAINDGRNTNDCNGHGTHVAGTVGGATYGVAPQVSLVAVRVLNCAGSGSTSGVIAGIDWVTANHAAGVSAVANMSLGGGYSLALNTATQNAIADGISFVVAAGNDNAIACNYSPASTPNAITVGATTSSDARASYSNYGSCVDIFAPGSSITSSWNTSPTATNTISGTSMASPHVAGAAALILSGSPSSTPTQVATALTAASTTGVVTDPAAGSPNRLLFTGDASVPQPPPPTAPANDNFANSVTLGSLAAVDGTTVAATHESGEPAHVSSSVGSAASIWYSWTAPADGTLALRTQGSSYDTLLAVYTGSAVSGLTQRAANDDTNDSSLWSQVSFSVTAGTVYRIAVDGYDGATGATRLAGTFTARLALTVPGAPTSVSGVSGNTQVVVSWSAPASNGGAVITAYTVTARPDGRTCLWSSGALSCTVTGLTNGTAYTFTVIATNSVGPSSASTASSAVTPATVPGAPTSVSGVSGNTQVVVSWTAPASTGGAAISAYTVTARPDGRTCLWSVGALGCPVTGLTNGTAYTFTVTATNSAGPSSASTASSAVTPATVPGAPTSIVVTRVVGSKASIAFSVGVSNGAAITTNTATCVSSDGGTTQTESAASTPILVSGLTIAKTYTCSVTSTNDVDTSSVSTASSSFLSSQRLSVPTFSGSGTISDSTGTLNCVVACSGAGMIPDSSVTLTATPASGWAFSSWGGACGGDSTTCSVLMDRAREVNAVFVLAPTSGSPDAPPPYTPPPIIINNNVTVNVTVITPINIQWSSPTLTSPLLAAFAAAPQTTYSIKATRTTRASKIVRGSCSVKRGKASCKIKLPSKGKWRVAITPKKKDKTGKPATKIIKI